mmetsp:Transcript_22923/g.55491  ORF Transcript_22923/g.55491 Transcript_22923/m.55491 type:complete len:224 (-) Transcript_22923:386-1057(-)
MGPSSAYFFTKEGTGAPEAPSMSSHTSTWPEVPLPAPMPMVGVRSWLVTNSATSAGTHSNTIAKHPASSSAWASRSSWRADSARTPCWRYPPRDTWVWGVRPTWPITPMPASTRARAVSTAFLLPPSSFTTSAFPSLSNRVALCSASRTVMYAPKGMSPTSSGTLPAPQYASSPRRTPRVTISISSMVTSTVESYPRRTLATESPTRTMSTPLSAASLPMVQS